MIFLAVTLFGCIVLLGFLPDSLRERGQGINSLISNELLLTACSAESITLDHFCWFFLNVNID